MDTLRSLVRDVSEVSGTSDDTETTDGGSSVATDESDLASLALEPESSHYFDTHEDNSRYSGVGFGRHFDESEVETGDEPEPEEEVDEIIDQSFRAKAARVRTSLKPTNIWLRIKQAWDEAEDLSSSDSEHVKSGRWDHWKAYYCTRESADYDKFSKPYFSWALMLTVGQCAGTDLIELCMANGGGAFLFVIFVCYIGIGFPLLVLETTMGQYSGRKPLQLFRYLCPALSGLGPALYFRTVMFAVYSLSFMLYSFHYCNDLYFCRMNDNKLLSAFHFTSLDFTEFKFGTFSRGNFKIFSPFILVLIFVLLVIVCSMKINILGRGYRLGIGGLFVVLLWYVGTGYTRISNVPSDSLAFYPLNAVLAFDWSKIVIGRTWMDAAMFVMNTLGLGTLAHPYLGSQLFYHYRVTRDAAGIVIMTFVWNLLGLLGVLLWLGYVCVNKEQMRLALQQIGGPYGVFVTFALKHNQAQMTTKLEGDLLFFNGFFYFIFGLAAFLALVCYIQILVACSYPEKVTPRIKIILLLAYCAFFALLIPFLSMTDEAIRHLTFLDYYYARSWSAFFSLGCFYWCVAYAHNFQRFSYDFRNINHFKIMPPAESASRYQRIARLPGLLCIAMATIYAAVHIQQPVAGTTEWSDLKIGIAISFIPFVCVVFVGVIELARFKGRKWSKAFKPHRDWYKNHFHNRRCFNELPSEKVKKKKKHKSKRKEAVEQTTTEAEDDAPFQTPQEILAGQVVADAAKGKVYLSSSS